MARLPDKLSLSGPASLRSGRTISSIDESGVVRGISTFGAGVQGAASNLTDIAVQNRRENNLIDGAGADGGYVRDLYDLEREVTADGDYSTYSKRFDDGELKIREKWGGVIRDPIARQRWKALASERSAAMRNRVMGVAGDREKEQELVVAWGGLKGYQDVFANPDVSDKERAAARRDADSVIAEMQKSGKLTPAQADDWRQKVINGGEFVLGQRIIERDPSVIKGNLPKSVSGRASAAMSYFTSRGWTKEQAAGIVGNLIGESSLDTGARNAGDGRDGSDSIGIGQWNAERARALKEFAALNRADWRDFEIQLAFVDHELRTSEKTAGDALKNARNIDEATAAFIGYERPKGWSAANPRGGHNYGGRLKFAAQAAGETIKPDWYVTQSPENQLRLENMAAARERAIQVESRGQLDIVVENAPAAIRSTGSYVGPLPGPGDFAAAYGPQEGTQRFEQFSTAVDVAQKTFDFQTMPASEIMNVVAGAKPTSSGDDAALQEKRYAVLESAAAASIKARNADPVTYTQRAFPAVAQAWQAAQQSGDYHAAMTATAAAQRQLGIADMQLLPGVVADSAVATFKDETKQEQQRIGAVANLIFATDDPEQRTAVFEQLVKAGLPEISAGAVRASARGDFGASRRLFEAAMVDVSKLPGKLPNTAAEIDEAIQSEIMDVGQIGDLYYGLSDGAADNYLTAQRDSKLMSNAVHMRIRKGEALEDAVQAVAKDLYGDIVPVNASNAQILVPADTNPDVVLRGLTASQPKLREAMERTMAVPEEAGSAAMAIINAERAAYIDQVMSEGYWRNSGQGFAFIDPFTGLAVADENGNPIVVTDKEAQTVAPPAEQQFPTMGTDYERQLMEDRARRAGQFGQ